MALNTPHNVTLTEGQIGIILCSLEKYFKGVKDTKEELLYLHNCTGAHKFEVRARNPYPDKLDAIYYSVRKKLTNLLEAD